MSDLSSEQLAFEEVLSGKRPLFPETSFKSEYGELTIKEVSLDRSVGDQIRKKEWLKADLETAVNSVWSGNLEEACKTLRNMRHSSWTEDFPKAFSTTLNSFYMSACLCLFERGVPNSENPESSYNLCHAFCAGAEEISEVFSFVVQNDQVSNVRDIKQNLVGRVLPATEAYLYALGRSLEEWTGAKRLGFIYRKAFRSLCKNKPNDSFITWALKSATEDKATQDLVNKIKPKPYLY